MSLAHGSRGGGAGVSFRRLFTVHGVAPRLVKFALLASFAAMMLGYVQGWPPWVAAVAALLPWAHPLRRSRLDAPPLFLACAILRPRGQPGGPLFRARGPDDPDPLPRPARPRRARRVWDTQHRMGPFRVQHLGDHCGPAGTLSLPHEPLVVGRSHCVSLA